jgi:hypothetical protein
LVPAFELLAPDSARSTNACSGLLDRISGIEVADETESADDFLVVRLLGFPFSIRHQRGVVQRQLVAFPCRKVRV